MVRSGIDQSWHSSTRPLAPPDAHLNYRKSLDWIRGSSTLEKNALASTSDVNNEAGITSPKNSMMEVVALSADPWTEREAQKSLDATFNLGPRHYISIERAMSADGEALFL